MLNVLIFLALCAVVSILTVFAKDILSPPGEPRTIEYGFIATAGFLPAGLLIKILEPEWWQIPIGAVVYLIAWGACRVLVDVLTGRDMKKS